MINAYAAFTAGSELEAFEYDAGVLANDDVEIQVEHCGICHSDLSMINNEWGLSQYPLVPGHEVIGTVGAIGAAVNHIAVGQRVGLGWHSSYCFSCGSCHSQDHNLCASAQGTIIGRHGGFADKVRANSQSVVILPEGIAPESAGPLFCGGVTVFNPIVQFDIKPMDKVAVIGIGGLGHLALQFLRAWGCEVTAFTSSESKRDEALSLGAHHVVDSRDKSALKAAMGSFDLILSTVNVKLNWNYYLEALKPKGRLHFVGATLEPLDVSVFSLISAQRSISGSPVGSPATIKMMLDFIVKHQISPAIEHFSFADVNQAIQHVADGKARYRVVLSHNK
jgi:alcohol/geraniol dehydrogenase (NADP+)